MIIEQRLTDMVEVDDLPGGISRLSFAFEMRKTPDPFYARTSHVRAIIEANANAPVHALAKIERAERFYPLNPACPESIFTDVPLAAFDAPTWRTRGSMPGPFATATDDVPVTPDTLFARDHFRERVISFATGKPVSIVTVMGGHAASAEYFDLPVLADLLGAHPWVQGVYYDLGRPGDYDHVAPSLTALVALPQDVYEQVLTAVDDRTQYANLDEVLFRLPLRTEPHPVLGADPLGIAPAKRTTKYRAPQDEFEIGESYPALEMTLPETESLYR